MLINTNTITFSRVIKAASSRFSMNNAFNSFIEIFYICYSKKKKILKK